MMLVRVVNWGTATEDGVVVGVKGADGRDHQLEMSREVALQMLLALRRAVSDLPPLSVPPVPAVIDVARCIEVVATGRKLGVVFETSEGLELPLALDQAAVDSLSSCIRGDRPTTAAH